jgi:hypothetical protein
MLALHENVRPSGDEIIKYFEIKTGHPEWPRQALQIIPVTFFDSSNGLGPS